MTIERWQDIQSLVKEKFKLINEGAEQLEEGPGSLEFMEFEGPLGTMRCEFIVRPKVLDQRGMGGHGVGRKIHTHYSADETTSSFHVFKLVNGDWEEIEAEMFK